LRHLWYLTHNSSAPAGDNSKIATIIPVPASVAPIIKIRIRGSFLQVSRNHTSCKPAASSWRTLSSQPRASAHSRALAWALRPVAAVAAVAALVALGAAASVALAAAWRQSIPAYSRSSGGIRPDHPTPSGRAP